MSAVEEFLWFFAFMLLIATGAAGMLWLGSQKSQPLSLDIEMKAPAGGVADGRHVYTVMGSAARPWIYIEGWIPEPVPKEFIGTMYPGRRMFGEK